MKMYASRDIHDSISRPLLTGVAQRNAAEQYAAKFELSSSYMKKVAG